MLICSSDPVWKQILRRFYERSFRVISSFDHYLHYVSGWMMSRIFCIANCIHESSPFYQRNILISIIQASVCG